jgi:hypothetical protein
MIPKAGAPWSRIYFLGKSIAKTYFLEKSIAKTYFLEKSIAKTLKQNLKTLKQN